MYFIQKFKLRALAALLLVAACLSTSLWAQTKKYYATVEKEGEDQVMYIKGYTQKPVADGNKILYVADNDLSIANLTEGMMPQAYENGIKRAKLEVDATFKPKSTANWFATLYNLERIEGLEKLNTSEVTNMSCMFRFCSKLKSLNLSKFNTAKVTEMGYMFSDCEKIEYLDVSAFDTRNVTDMTAMFKECYTVRYINLGAFNTTNLRFMNWMFQNCSALTGIFVNEKAVITTTKVTADYGKEVFDGCVKLQAHCINTTKTNALYLFRFDAQCINKDYFKILPDTDAIEKVGKAYLTKTQSNLETISLSKPKNTKCRYGEDIDLSYGWINKYVYNIPASSYGLSFPLIDLIGTVTGFNNKSIGKQTVSVKYGDQTFSFNVEVVDYVKEVSVTAEPRRNYPITTTAATFSLGGGLIKKVYASGKTLYCNLDTTKFEIKRGLDVSSLGEKTLELSFNLGDTVFSYNHTIELYDVLKGIKLVAPTKTKYHIGEEFKVEEFFKGMQYVETWHHKGDTTYDIGAMVSEASSALGAGADLSMEAVLELLKTRQIELQIPDTKTAGKKQITVKYNGFESTSEIEVVEALTAITLLKEPAKTKYLFGEDIENYKLSEVLDGLEIGLEWISGDQNNLPLASIINSITLDNPNLLQVLSVLSESGIDLQKMAVLNETLSLTSIITKIVEVRQAELGINSAIPQLKEAGFDIELFNTNQLGEQKLTIKMGDFELSWDVEIVDYLIGVSAVVLPEVYRYEMPFSEADLNLSGGVIRKVYASGEEVDMAMDTLEWTVEGMDTAMEEGLQTIRLSFELGDTTFVWHYEIELVDIPVDFSMVSKPTNTKYKKGEYIKYKDLIDGVVLRLEWSSGKEDTIALGDFAKDWVAKVESGEIEISDVEWVPEGIVDTISFYLTRVIVETFGVGIGGDLNTLEVGTYELKFLYSIGKGEFLECGCEIEVFEPSEGGDDPTVTVEDLNAGGGAAFEAWTSRGVLYVSAARGGVLEVLSVNGVLVRREEVAGGSSVNLPLEKGVYVLRLGGDVRKVVVE